jgi:hypothetical protein
MTVPACRVAYIAQNSILDINDQYTVVYGEVNMYSTSDVLDFLEHAGDRGLMPPATAQALAVACRRIFEILDDGERADVRKLDLDELAQRFANKRASDFRPDSLKEYQRRLKRAVDGFISWREDPTSYRAPRRASKSSKDTKQPGVRSSAQLSEDHPTVANSSRSRDDHAPAAHRVSDADRYFDTNFPLRAGHVVTVRGVPIDMTKAESDRLAQFLAMFVLKPEKL